MFKLPVPFSSPVKVEAGWEEGGGVRLSCCDIDGKMGEVNSECKLATLGRPLLKVAINWAPWTPAGLPAKLQIHQICPRSFRCAQWGVWAPIISTPCCACLPGSWVMGLLEYFFVVANFKGKFDYIGQIWAYLVSNWTLLLQRNQSYSKRLWIINFIS